MVVVATLTFNFGDHSSLVVYLDANYVDFVCFLHFFRSNQDPMFIYSWLSFILSWKYFSRIRPDYVG